MSTANKTLIKAYFAKFYKKELTDDQNLFELGVLDSMGIVSLIGSLENENNLIIDPEDITEENFSTINNICTCLKKYQ